MEDNCRTLRHDLCVFAGPGGWRQTFVYTQPDGTTPLDLTGYTFTAKMAPRGEGEEAEDVLNFTVANGRLVVDEEAGTVTMVLTEAEKEDIPSQAGRDTEYELVGVDSLDFFFHRWWGTVHVDPVNVNA